MDGQRGVSRLDLAFASKVNPRGDGPRIAQQTSLGTAPKNSKAATIPSRIASVRSNGRARTKGALE
jgi:hypothetical protein